jgi:hypothetical protein
MLRSNSCDLRSRRWCWPHQGLFACGSKEMTIYVVCSGGFAARTNDIPGFFRPAGGEKPVAV